MSYSRVPIGDVLLCEFAQPAFVKEMWQKEITSFIFYPHVWIDRGLSLSHISGHGPLAKLGQAKADQ